ncbi:MAG TPA: helix-turn-helix domain-containing protein [Nakamurella multipartita]|jgi:AcrR family transcriptional regulator|nr:helix-turn-helix domain-containing protein [Nakamurella multipartita]
MTIRETAPGRTQRTRARLQTAALELFARQGYEATTVAQIAAAAGVTEMTFYRHFGTKDQLLLDDPYDPLMAGAVAAQPPGLPPVIRAVRGIRAAWRAVPIQDTGPVRDRLAIVAATPSLAAAVRANTAASEAAIGAELAAGGADPREAAIAAAAVMAALMTALLQWGRDGDGTLSAAIERALDVVEAHHD